MSNIFPASGAEIKQLGVLLIEHLRTIPDTHEQKEWTSANLKALRTFRMPNSDLQHFPPSPDSNQKNAFLWDYIAYQQGHGILVVAESEHNYKDVDGLKHDFEKLFYAIAPIKLFMFIGHREQEVDQRTDTIVAKLRAYMTECCSRFMPGELYILYCRTWKRDDGNSGDRAYFLQIPGEPGDICALSDEDRFKLEPAHASAG